ICVAINVFDVFPLELPDEFLNHRITHVKDRETYSAHEIILYLLLVVRASVKWNPIKSCLDTLVCYPEPSISILAKYPGDCMGKFIFGKIEWMSRGTRCT